MDIFLSLVCSDEQDEYKIICIKPSDIKMFGVDKEDAYFIIRDSIDDEETVYITRGSYNKLVNAMDIRLSKSHLDIPIGKLKEHKKNHESEFNL
jgi:hypothetical protein